MKTETRMQRILRNASKYEMKKQGKNQKDILRMLVVASGQLQKSGKITDFFAIAEAKK